MTGDKLEDGTSSDSKDTAQDRIESDDAPTIEDDGAEPSECEEDEDCDGEPKQCHEFKCEDHKCKEVPLEDNSPCSDENLCTENDTCQKGECVSGPSRNCNDNNPCTEDSCDPVASCVNTPITSDETLTCGLGECYREVPKCTNGVLNVCVPGELSEEVCDGKDNDCDGFTDEDLSRACTVTNDFGTCSGTETCNAGNWVGCTANMPGVEICNNIDDDCDGLTDEELSQPCTITNEFGSCTGTETCIEGNWMGCTAKTPAEEICNNIDDNCDGLIDEELSQPCAITNEFGTCTGTESCIAGNWVGCTANTPAAEICNDIDDNCDGLTDEGFDLSSDPNNCGQCGNVCVLTNQATGIACVDHACTVTACEPGWFDLDQIPTNGCEHFPGELWVDWLNLADPDQDGSIAHPFDTIQKALEVAKNGTMVHVLEGMYSGPIAISQPNLVLSGAGQDLVQIASANGATGITISADNVTIRDLSIGGGRHGLIVHDVAGGRIQSVRLNNIGGSNDQDSKGITIVGSSAFVIEDVEINGVLGGDSTTESSKAGKEAVGIFASNCQNLVISSARIHGLLAGHGWDSTGSSTGGIGGWASGIRMVSCTNCRVTESVVNDIRAGRGGSAPNSSDGSGGSAWGIEWNASSGTKVDTVLVYDIVGGTSYGAPDGYSGCFGVQGGSASLLDRFTCIGSGYGRQRGFWLGSGATAPAALVNGIFAHLTSECLYSAAGNSPTFLTATYSNLFDCQGGQAANATVSTGCISSDPMFVDEANADYHLHPTSPCINVGNPSSTYCDEPPPNGCRVDMGSHGNTFEATSAPNTGNCACSKLPVLNSATIVLPDSVAALVDNPYCGTQTFPLVNGMPPFDAEIGSIIVSGFDGGFLCRIVEAELGLGGLVLTTVPASLNEAIDEGAIEFTVPLQIGDDAPPTPLRGPVTPQSSISTSVTLRPTRLLDVGGATVTLRAGHVAFEPDLFVKGWYTLGEGVYFRAVASGDIDVDVGVDVAFNGGMTIAPQPVTVLTKNIPFLFSIGPIPIPGHVEVKIKAGIKGSISGGFNSSYGIRTHRTMMAGVEHRNDVWRKIQFQEQKSSQRYGPTLDASVTAGLEVYVDVDLKLIFYKALGPTLTVTPSAKAGIAAQMNGGYEWDLSACLSADFGGEVWILHWLLAKYETNLFKRCWNLWSGSGCVLGGTCCSASGTWVDSGQNGPGCTGECKQCNGAGGCVNKTNGTSCSTGSCQNGTCIACSSNFCQTNGYSSGTYCDGQSKVTCGTQGACKIETARVACGSGTVCQSGSCVSCGGSGQPCCSGNTCNSGYSCSAGTCQSCPSNFCQNNGYSSGTYCDGQSKVTCGTQGACKVETARVACGSGTVCQNGSCCEPNSYKMCSSGDIYWYDSCGNRGSVAESCSCGCSGSSCTSPCCTTEVLDYEDNDCDDVIDDGFRVTLYRRMGSNGAGYTNPNINADHCFSYSETGQNCVGSSNTSWPTYLHDGVKIQVYKLSIGSGDTVWVGSVLLARLAECYNASRSEHEYWTTDSAQYRNLKSAGWSCVNVGYVKTGAPAGRDPLEISVRRHNHAVATDTMYSTVVNEGSDVGFVDRGVAWFAWALP
ncbi:hypothetical protein KBB45_07890 [Myxococcota bacterium]|jgi:hypothetical protein|nr:hypothetical protein [Myxococcota bacterium]MBP8970482.1 hypothetical protein [Myxococcota bacterium]HHW97330.1 hypothetical protein [Oligoflexales bacterium]HQL56944.1 MopE-related protein [Myxococcota bacterium]